MILEIKQIGKFGDRDKRSDYGVYTMQPMSARSYVVKRGVNNKFITGLEDNEQKRQELENALGVDLTERSDFWTKFRMTFSMPTGVMKLNTNDPKQELISIVAQANHVLAPDEESLKDYLYKKNDAIFYISDEEKQKEKLNLVQELKDAIGALMYQTKNNKERMLFIAHNLNLFVTETFGAADLYALLNKYRENQKTVSQLQAFKAVLDKPNTDLQITYYFEQGFKLQIISFDTNIKQFKFVEKHIGKTKDQSINYFKEKKNEADLAFLIMEVKEKQNK